MTTPATPAADAASLPEPSAHMYPSDLERFETSETFAQAYSVAVGCPDERSVPLFTLSKLTEYATARESALKQQHALQIISLEAQADERESALVAERDSLRATAGDLLVALRDLEAMAERYRQPGYPVPYVQKRAIAAIAKASECAALAAPAVEG